MRIISMVVVIIETTYLYACMVDQDIQHTTLFRHDM